LADARRGLAAAGYLRRLRRGVRGEPVPGGEEPTLATQPVAEVGRQVEPQLRAATAARLT